MFDCVNVEGVSRTDNNQATLQVCATFCVKSGIWQDISSRVDAF